LEKDYYLQLILRGIGDYGKLSRKEAEALLLNKLPDCYTEDQKKKKVEHLLAELKQSGKIVCKGKGKNSYWHFP
jgi:ATP-dependent DNA helicase RecG